MTWTRAALRPAFFDFHYVLLHGLLVPGEPGRRAALSDERAAALASALRAARQREQITTSELARAAGVTVELVRRLERGDTNPTLATLYAVADVVRVRLRDLLPD